MKAGLKSEAEAEREEVRVKGEGWRGRRGGKGGTNEAETGKFKIKQCSESRVRNSKVFTAVSIHVRLMSFICILIPASNHIYTH